MTHKEYITKYLKWSVDNDWYYGKQCMDLAHHYCINVHWVDCPKWDAYAVWSKVWNTAYIKIPNTLNNSPRQWDIIIFAPTSTNKYWHIAIVDNGNDTNVWVLEQNAWTWNWDGKWSNAIRLSIYNYVNPKVVWRFRFLPERQLIEDQILRNWILRDTTKNQQLKDKLKETNDYLRAMMK